LVGHLHLRKKQRNHREKWIHAMTTAGVTPEIFSVESVSAAERVEAERFWIAYFRSLGCRLVNATDGGEGSLGRRLSAESLLKMSASLKGKPSAFRGLRHTAASREKIRIASAARWLRPEEHARNSISHIGKKATLEARAKMSATRRANPSPGFSGRVHSPQTRSVMAMRRTSRKHSEETRMKMAVSQRERRRAEQSTA
jgi:hypothetical protein